MKRLSTEGRSENMRRIQSKHTKPEIIIRRLVYHMGYRYRLHRRDLPGKPDLVFPGKMKVIFVNGCFWHQHSSSGCKIAHKPKTNLDYWLPKLERNIARDLNNRKLLSQLGWRYLTIWECETKDASHFQGKISEFLDNDAQ